MVAVIAINCKPVVNYMSLNAGKKSRMGFVSNLEKLTNVSQVCIFCVFKRIVEWLPYDPFSKCSKKCDGGMQERYRECNTGTIKDCKQYVGGSEIERVECNTFKCEWLEYNEWSECSKVCKGGIQTRYRDCSTGNIKDCIDMFGGNNMEERKCNQQKCKWIVRSKGSCSNTVCGEGEQKVYRYCESGNNNDCDGDKWRIEKCYSYFGCIKYGIVIIVILICAAWSIYRWCEINKAWIIGALSTITIVFAILIFTYFYFGWI